MTSDDAEKAIAEHLRRDAEERHAEQAKDLYEEEEIDRRIAEALSKRDEK